MTSSKAFALFAAALLVCVSGAVQAYNTPIGIPAPDFGPALGNPVTTPIPVNPPGWPGQEVPGHYYIDNTASSATDSTNWYGYPDRPRKSIPRSLPAGSVVEVRGGPYRFATDANFTLNGTASAPVFLYGVNKPVLDGPVKTSINGSYFVFDGFVIRNSHIQTLGMEYAIIRNTEVQGNAGTGNGVTLAGSNIVLYNDNIHHHQGDDKHGIVIAEGSHDVWVLGNWLHHNGGDGIQFCHGCTQSPPQYVYIGGNVINSNRENGIDLKYSRYVVVSQNEVYSHWTSVAGVKFCYDDGSGCTTGSSGSDGTSILVGTSGTPGDIWVLFNEIHDSNKGIRVVEVYNGVVLGNVIHDVDAVGIEFALTGAGPVTAAFNTIHNTAMGIHGPWEQGVLQITMDNNILSRISGDSIDIRYAAASSSTASNNLFYNDGDSISIRWNTRAWPTAGADIDSVTAGTGNLIGDPMFRNPSAADFNVLASGAGVNQANSKLVTLNDQYRSIFGSGVSILRDFANIARSSSGMDHDIGAYESYTAVGNAPPLPPVLQ